MEENSIRKYANLMRELGLTALEIEEGGCSLRLERSETRPPAVPAAPEDTAGPRAGIPAADENIREVRSPMVGVFYASPTEDSDPYVIPGQKVSRGDVLCIIEAMKLMNEITSEYSGTVEEVCVGNNQPVDFNRLLFRVRKEI